MVPCRQCEVYHETLYDCPHLERILPPDVPMSPLKFGAALLLLINEQALPEHVFERDNQDICHRCGAKENAPWHK